jgi:GAF domain-containing protein
LPARIAARLKAERGVLQSSEPRTSQASVSAALAAARAGTREHFAATARPSEDNGGTYLAGMAQRDLDAALQLLADRAQYITGANGAAIALRNGKSDMLCRASVGANAPELGALLSTEFGLSGESVRTRQALRCDDAERDARVNHEVCRQLGIASVVVMPVVHDDEVLGVFELFSGKTHAFSERDLAALQRLSEMVETAVRLARVAGNLPEKLSSAESALHVAEETTAKLSEPAADAHASTVIGEFEADIFEAELVEAGIVATRIAEPDLAETALAAKVAGAAAESPVERKIVTQVVSAAPMVKAAADSVASAAPVAQAKEPAKAVPATSAAKKPLIWSAAPSAGDVQESAPAAQSHVPAVLRQLKQCAACGFPVSPGREYCVECEEKRWRGQLKRTSTPLAEPANPHISQRTRDMGHPGSGSAAAAVAPAREPEAKAAQAVAKPNESKSLAGPSVAAKPAPASAPVIPGPVVLKATTAETTAKVEPRPARTSSPELVLSAGLQPSQSWLAANKYIVGALLVVAAVVAGILLLR